MQALSLNFWLDSFIFRVGRKFILEAIEKALEEFEQNAKGKTSPKHTKIYEIEKFAFKDKFLSDIDNDIALFEQIKKDIEALNLVANDPKRKEVLRNIKKVLNEKTVPKRKIIVFTEYTDTVRHLETYFNVSST